MRWLFAGAAAGLIAACTFHPRPIEERELADKANLARAATRAAALPAEQPIGFNEAIARALARNLDIRIADLESVIARGSVNLSDLAMLPQLVASRAYTHRNPPGASTDKIPGDTDRTTSSLELSWSVLDFGISYVRARQAGNDALAAEERRRRLANGIVNDVRLAFWTAALGERRQSELRAIAGDIEAAMKRSRQLAELKLQDPVVALSYQDGLLELERQMKSYGIEIEQARTRLARLLNLYPGTQLRLAAGAPEDSFRNLGAMERATLEDVALVTRSELRELDYSTRNRNLDVISAVALGLPSFRLRAAELYDSTTSLQDNRWHERGWSYSFNIIGLLSALERTRLARQGVAMFEVRRLALGLAVMEQVDIAREQIAVLDEDYELAKRMSAVRRTIYEIRRDRVPFDTIDELERIRAAVSAVAADIREDRAYAALQKAYGDLLASIGIDQFPDGLDLNAPEAPAAIETHLASLPAAVRGLAARIEELRAESAMGKR
ncbi:MAG TPA: TolC family protein [Burkholderiales bacterium]